MKRRYRFVGRDGGIYIWQSVRPEPGDSRHEEITCSVDWFWSAPRRQREAS